MLERRRSQTKASAFSTRSRINLSQKKKKLHLKSESNSPKQRTARREIQGGKGMAISDSKHRQDPRQPEQEPFSQILHEGDGLLINTDYPWDVEEVEDTAHASFA